MESEPTGGEPAPKHREPIPVDDFKAAAEQRERDGVPIELPDIAAAHRKMVRDALQPLADAARERSEALNAIVAAPKARMEEYRRADEERRRATDEAVQRIADAQRERERHERNSRRMAAWALVVSVGTLLVTIVALIWSH